MNEIEKSLGISRLDKREKRKVKDGEKDEELELDKNENKKKFKNDDKQKNRENIIKLVTKDVLIGNIQKNLPLWSVTMKLV